MTSEKRLLRSRKALIGGVCAGVADYFNVDPLIVRIIMVVFTWPRAGCWASRTSCCGSCCRSNRRRRRRSTCTPSRCIPRRTGTLDFGTRAKLSRGRKMRPIPRKRPAGAMRISPYASASRGPPRAPGRRPSRASTLRLPMLLVHAAGDAPHEGWMHRPRRNRSSRRRSRRAPA